MDDFGILDGVTVSIFSMLIVFLILVVLALLVSLLRYLPSKEEKQNVKKPAATAQKQIMISDEEERMVAMLVASCVAKEQIDKDVRIVSIERTK